MKINIPKNQKFRDVIKIKKLYILIIILCVILAGGCSPDAEPVSGAVLDLEARFADMFEEPASADGTLRFTEAPPETVAPQSAEPTEAEPQTDSEITQENTDIAAILDMLSDIINNLDADNIQDIIDIAEILEEITEHEPEIDEERFAVTPSGRRFHTQGCHHARNAGMLLTRAEAEGRGLEPCRTCNP